MSMKTKGEGYRAGKEQTGLSKRSIGTRVVGKGVKLKREGRSGRGGGGAQYEDDQPPFPAVIGGGPPAAAVVPPRPAVLALASLPLSIPPMSAGPMP